MQNLALNHILNNSLQKVIQTILPVAFRALFVKANRSEYVQVKFVEEFTGTEIKTKTQNFEVSSNYVKD